MVMLFSVLLDSVAVVSIVVVALTVTVSPAVDTFIVMLRLLAWPTVRSIPCVTIVEKPSFLAMTSYRPGVNARKANLPFSSLVAACLICVSRLCASTDAPGMTAPEGSSTVP